MAIPQSVDPRAMPQVAVEGGLGRGADAEVESAPALEPRRTKLGRQILSALGTLYDMPRLQTHPLAATVAGPGDGRSKAGARLQESLLDAIEVLRPGPEVHQSSPAWRGYHLLRLRYVEALDVAAVQSALAIGHSEYYREHRRALDAVVTVFRARYLTSAALPPLPIPLTSFVGRAAELAQVQTILERARLLTLTGPPGSGKTRLALEAAAGCAAAFRHGVRFVALAAVTDPELVLPAVAHALGIRLPAASSLTRALAEALRDQELLLLLDNFEQVVEGAPAIAALLQACPQLRVLATSRIPLGLAGEREFPVPPLDLPDLRRLPSLEELAEHAAIALFVARAQDVLPDFALTDENAGAVAAICAHLDGLPLAIELAAARSKLLPPAAMLARVESRLSFLTGGPRDRPARQQSLRAAIDGSYELLGQTERDLFAQLAVFAGGANLEVIEQVVQQPAPPAPELLDRLGALLDSSLLRREPGSIEPRYTMLETIREYGLERLTTSGEAPAVRDRHATYYLALAERVESFFAEPPIAWLDLVEREHDNLRAALAWLLEGQDAERACRLGAALGGFWFLRGYYAEGRERLAQALALAPDAATPARARALIALGGLAHAQGDDVSARRLFEQALAIEQQAGEEAGIGAGFFNLARVAANAGDWGTARSCAERSLAIARGADDDFGAARSLLILGRVAHHQGELAQARTLWQDSRVRFERLGGGRGLASVLCRLGILAVDEGDYAAARALLAQSVGIYQQLAHPWGIAQALEGFAGLAAAEGRAPRAARLAGAADALRTRIGSPLSPALRAELHARLARVPPTDNTPSVDTATAEGRSLSMEAAIALALQVED